MTINEKLDFDLYLITDSGVVGDRDLVDVVEEAIKGGVKAVQLREKFIGGKELFKLAKKLKVLTNKYNAQLLINDRVDICLAVDADGVHLPSDGMRVKDARALLGREKLIGVSCHSVEDVVNAETEGADFVTVGPIYDTPSKSKFGKPVGLEVLEKAKGKGVHRHGVKVFALGGIKLDKVEECIKSGADGVALISGILASEDVEKTTKDYLKEINNIKL